MQTSIDTFYSPPISVVELKGYFASTDLKEVDGRNLMNVACETEE